MAGGWTNPDGGERPDGPAMLLCADWLEAVRSVQPGSVDLLYADPPFNTGSTREGRGGRFEDRWPSVEAWTAWLGERLEATLPALKPTACVLLHVDWRTSHHARLVLDRVLGSDRFVNHLVWAYGLGGSSARRFARKHDDVLFYAVDAERYWFEAPEVAATSRRLRGAMKKATDVLHIPAINNMASERTGYPTQKPVALLDVLVRACCPPGGVVLDPCCGSGTTALAAVGAGRRALASDINAEAVRIAGERLGRATPAGAGCRSRP